MSDLQHLPVSLSDSEWVKVAAAADLDLLASRYSFALEPRAAGEADLTFRTRVALAIALDNLSTIKAVWPLLVEENARLKAEIAEQRARHASHSLEISITFDAADARRAIDEALRAHLGKTVSEDIPADPRSAALARAVAADKPLDGYGRC